MGWMDWGDGDYERTAATLEAAASRAAAAAAIAPGMRVLDLGCGTGNAAIEAARRGAEVVAVDPSPRLLEVCRTRAAREALAVTTKEGDASRIPSEDRRARSRTWRRATRTRRRSASRARTS